MATAFLSTAAPLRLELAAPCVAPGAAHAHGAVAPPTAGVASGAAESPAGWLLPVVAGSLAGFGSAVLAAATSPRPGRRPRADGTALALTRALAAHATSPAVVEAQAPTAPGEGPAADGVEEAAPPAEAAASMESSVAEIETSWWRALPFMPVPAYRTFVRNVPGDAGFDPLGLAGDSPESFLRMFDAELKHGRVAMLAFAGFAGPEILHERLAEVLALDDLMADYGCTPTLLNGGIFVPELIAGLLPILGVMAYVDINVPKNMGLPGYYGFDPLGFRNVEFSDFARSLLSNDTEWVAEAEMKHGRLAMLAVTWCWIQEFLTQEPIFPAL
mmetsp:Transcript_122204/g.340637  ORF Transcript_122204/g.340637 Transcript_122204/m.340637 type:complete len:330 (-) Transcript_122204:160-1149(-)